MYMHTTLDGYMVKGGKLERELSTMIVEARRMRVMRAAMHKIDILCSMYVIINHYSTGNIIYTHAANACTAACTIPTLHISLCG